MHPVAFNFDNNREMSSIQGSGFNSFITESDHFAAQSKFSDGMDEEERETIRRAEADQQERMRLLSFKQSEEMRLKKERREIGKRALDDWYSKRD